MQNIRQRADFLARLLAQRQAFLQRVPRIFGSCLLQEPGQRDIEREQILCGAIVKFPRDSAPFGVLQVQKARGQQPQFRLALPQCFFGSS